MFSFFFRNCSPLERHRVPSADSSASVFERAGGRLGFEATIALSSLFLASTLGTLACSGEGYVRDWNTDAAAGPGMMVGPCQLGEERPCGFTVDQESGVVSCYQGRQVCDDGTWSSCQDGSIVKIPDPRSDKVSGWFETQAISTMPLDCKDPNSHVDVCDPYCRFWDESPGDPLGGMGGASGGTGGTPGFGPGPFFECEHDLCTEGAALSDAPACDPCVADVCASEPDCCDPASPTGWDATCRLLAYFLCTDVLPAVGLCDFGFFAETTVSLGNGADGEMAIYGDTKVDLGVDGTYQLVWSNGNINFANANGVSFKAPGGILSRTGSVSFAAGTGNTIDGEIHAATSVNFNGGITVKRDVKAGTNVTNQNSNTVLGDVVAAGTISSGLAAGSKTEGVPVAAPSFAAPGSIPTRSVSCSGADSPVVGIPHNTDHVSGTTGSVTIPPGDYGDVVVSGSNSAVVLDGEGSYTFNSLRFDSGCNGCRLQLGTSAAAYTGAGWSIDVCSNFRFDGPGAFVAAGDGTVLDDPKQLYMYVDGNVTLGNTSKLGGVVQIPNGSFTADNNSEVRGAVWANAVSAGPGLGGAQISKADCEAMNIPGTTAPPGACPIDNRHTPPDPISSDCESGLDCQSNTRCDEVATDPSCSHSKCRPGEAFDSTCRSNDACVDLICDTNPSCCNSSSGSWSQACVDQVEQLCDVTCGTGGRCFHGPQEVGAPLDPSCGICQTKVCTDAAGDPSCCSTEWGASCVALAESLCCPAAPPSEAPPGDASHICDYAAYAEGALALSGTISTADTPLDSFDFWSLVPAGFAPHLTHHNRISVLGGNVGAVSGAMTLHAANIEQNVYITEPTSVWKTFALSNWYDDDTAAPDAATNRLEGDYENTASATWTKPTRPTISSVCDSSAGLVTFSGSGGLAPGGYHGPANASASSGFEPVTVANGTTLRLEAGNYDFNALNIGENVQIVMPASGDVTIHVCGPVTLGDGTFVSGLVHGTAGRLLLETSGTLNIGSDVQLYGIYSASLDLEVGEASTIRGAAWSGGSLRVGRGSMLDARGTRASCLKRQGTSYTSTQEICSYSILANLVSLTTNGDQSGTKSFYDGLIRSRTDFANVNSNNNNGAPEFNATIIAGGSVSLDDATVNGAVVTEAGTVALNGSSEVENGAIWEGVSLAAPPDLPAPPAPVTSGCSNLSGTGTTGGSSVNTSSSLSLAPNMHYGSVAISGSGSTLTLAPGTYYLDSLTVRNGATLNISGSGNVDVVLCRDFDLFENNPQFTMNGGETGASALRFRLHSYSTAVDAIRFESTDSFAGVLLAHNGGIRMGASVSNLLTHHVLTWAAGDVVFASQNANDTQGMTGTNCEATDLATGSVASCSIPIGDPAEEPSGAGACVDNVGYTQPYCSGTTTSGADLALGVPCDDVVPVCNHGDVDYVGVLDATFWDASYGEMSTLDPVFAQAEGACSSGAPVTVPAGDCVDLTCVGIAGGAYSIMLNSENTMVECSRLDNWTLSDGRSCGGAGAASYIERYEARCPESSQQGVWQFIGWRASIDPGSAATIDFSVRTGKTEGEVDLAMWLPVGEANEGATNCPPLTSCSINVEAVYLSDGRSYNELAVDWLDLKIDILPDGDAPTLDDWKVTYSCQYDQ